MKTRWILILIVASGWLNGIAQADAPKPPLALEATKPAQLGESRESVEKLYGIPVRVDHFDEGKLDISFYKWNGRQLCVHFFGEKAACESFFGARGETLNLLPMMAVASAVTQQPTNSWAVMQLTTNQLNLVSSNYTASRVSGVGGRFILTVSTQAFDKYEQEHLLTAFEKKAGEIRGGTNAIKK